MRLILQYRAQVRLSRSSEPWMDVAATDDLVVKAAHASEGKNRL